MKGPRDKLVTYTIACHIPSSQFTHSQKMAACYKVQEVP